MALNKYFFIAFFPIGFITNILSFLVMRMKHNRHLSTCVYLSITAINDNIFLALALHLWFAKHVESTHYTKWVCKVKVFAVHVCGSFGAYEIILMTLDKLVAIVRPHKSAVLCTARRAKLSSGVNLLVCLLFYLPLWDFTSLLGDTSQCARYVRQGWYVTAYMYIALVVNPIIPVIAIFLMNTVIIRAVWNSRNLRTSLDERNPERQITLMLILVSIMLVILLLPMEISDNYYYYVGEPTDPEHFASLVFSFRLTKEIFNLNYGINFFLYLISGSKFRNDLKSLLCGKKSSKRNVSETSDSHNFPGSSQTDTKKF